ncbi:MAG: DUF5663 domain-containing protein [bacterium]
MNPIKKQVEDVLNLEGLTEEEKENRITDAGALIYQDVLMRVMEIMSEGDQDEFEKLLDNNAQPTQIFDFLNSKVPNFEGIIKEEALNYVKHSNDIMSQIG